MKTTRVLLLVGIAALLASCSGSHKPLVYKHPETKSIILLEGKTLQCEPLFRKAGFEKMDAGMQE